MHFKTAKNISSRPSKFINTSLVMMIMEASKVAMAIVIIAVWCGDGDGIDYRGNDEGGGNSDKKIMNTAMCCGRNTNFDVAKCCNNVKSSNVTKWRRWCILPSTSLMFSRVCDSAIC